jgi:hypothetical protein
MSPSKIRSFSKAIVFGVVAVLAGVAFWYFQIKREAEKKETKEQEALLFHDFEGKTVSRVVIGGKDRKQIVIERGVTGTDSEGKEEYEWRILEPIRSLADKSVVDLLVDDVLKAKREEIVQESSDKMDEYGLKDPIYSVRLTFEDGAKTGILFGIQSLDRKHTFVSVPGREGIVEVPTDVYTTVKKGLFDVRDKEIAHFKKDDVEEMIVLSGLGQVVIQREGDTWYLLPGRVEASKNRVELFIGALQWGTFASVVEEEGKSLKPYGLNAPRLIANVRFADQEPFVFAVGNPSDDKHEFYYATRSTDGMIFEVKADTVKSLVKSEFELKERSILSFEDADVAEISLSHAGGDFTFVRKGEDNWAFADDGVIVENGYKIDNILRGLRLAEYEVRDPIKRGDPHYADTGIEKAPYRVTIRFKDDRAPLTVAITEKDERTGKSFLTPDGGDTVYITSTYFLSYFPSSRDDLMKK